MTQQEFFERTMVKVSNDEFWAIVTVYNNSDLGKDEFCKMWCKMNQSRVNAAKAESKQAKRMEAVRRTLEKWYLKEIHNHDNYYTLIAYTKVSTKVISAVSAAGIKFGNAETLSDVLWKVGQYLCYHK